MANPNIKNMTTVNGQTVAVVAPTTPSGFLTNSSSSNKVYKINLLNASNIDTVNTISVSLNLIRSVVAPTGTYSIITSVDVPAKATISLLDRPLYLNEGDSVSVNAGGANKIHIVASYEDIS